MTRQYSRRTLLSSATSAIAAAVASSLPGDECWAEASTVLSGAIMGTTYRVTIPELPTGVSVTVMHRALRDTLEQIDETMSTYRAMSEVSRFNRAATNEWIPISEDTSRVAETALFMADFTKGAFDPTVGPLVDLWGFGPSGPVLRIPDAETVAVKRQQISHTALEWRRDPPALRKRLKGLRVDFSGIAEGHAVDRMAGVLDRFGVVNFLVELGGEIRCRAAGPEGRSWTISIETPGLTERRSRKLVMLTNGAIATSGDYRKFFVAGGRRYSHVIDPRTGYPVDEGLASVTVIRPSAMESDVLSTALLVLGPKAGFDFAERHRIAAMFITRGRTGFRERTSTSFFPYLKEQPT